MSPYAFKAQDQNSTKAIFQMYVVTASAGPHLNSFSPQSGPSYPGSHRASIHRRATSRLYPPARVKDWEKEGGLRVAHRLRDTRHCPSI